VVTRAIFPQDLAKLKSLNLGPFLKELTLNKQFNRTPSPSQERQGRLVANDVGQRILQYAGGTKKSVSNLLEKFQMHLME
jgi:hypothetical protein